jgi:hypothetical protein
MTAITVERDERTVAVENASYRWAYFVLAFGLLVAIAYRSFALHTASWDLFALIIGSGAVKVGYQGRQQVLSRRWLWMSLLTAAVAAVLAAVLVWFR